MGSLKPALLFVLQSIVVGLAVAFLVVLIRPELLPGIADRASSGSSYADAVDISAPSVANIYTTRLVQYSPQGEERPRFRIENSFGSAVVIDPDGYLVTNYHVVAQAAEIIVQMPNGVSANGELVGVDAETDLALLRVDLGTLPAIVLGNSGQLRVGDVVLAIGNPYGLTATVTQGVIGGKGRVIPRTLTTFQDYIQTDAAINAGNSGGALINIEGELVGINTAILAQDAETEGIGFAIPVDLVRGVVEELKQHGRVIRGWMGFQPDDLTAAERGAAGIESNVGILLSEVFEGGPAHAANLRIGDIITEINDVRIFSDRQARLLVAGAKPGDEVNIIALRDGEEFRVTVTVAERPGAPD